MSYFLAGRQPTREARRGARHPRPSRGKRSTPDDDPSLRRRKGRPHPQRLFEGELVKSPYTPLRPLGAAADPDCLTVLGVSEESAQRSVFVTPFEKSRKISV
jgi:hypothetical protein